jgi:hypothetical protein
MMNLTIWAEAAAGTLLLANVVGLGVITLGSMPSNLVGGAWSVWCRWRGKRLCACGAHVPSHLASKHEQRDLTGGIGHNLPQEAPQAFAQAVVDVDRFS